MEVAHQLRSRVPRTLKLDVLGSIMLVISYAIVLVADIDQSASAYYERDSRA